MRITNLILALCLVFVVSCAAKFEGRQIDPAKVKQMQMGQTSAADVEKLLGQPQKIEKSATGEDAYVYYYQVINAHWWTRSQTDKQDLIVTIKNGTVKDYRFTQEGKEAVLKE
jgi:outer membrane protein assembly factor BamE (lipoprotein component of BamABCDE complex)